MNGWEIVASVVGAVGGIIGIIFGGLGIWYAHASNLRESEEHRLAMMRFRREEEEREVARRKDALLRAAHEDASSMQSPATMLMISVTLKDELDQMAAWELQKEGRATVNGDKLTITVDTTPPGLRRGI